MVTEVVVVAVGVVGPGIVDDDDRVVVLLDVAAVVAGYCDGDGDDGD